VRITIISNIQLEFTGSKNISIRDNLLKILNTSVPLNKPNKILTTSKIKNYFRKNKKAKINKLATVVEVFMKNKSSNILQLYNLFNTKTVVLKDIENILNNNKMSGGYYEKYLKYKQKYLQLKKNL
jgi:predicted component of type VI protein secretion system